MAAEPIDLEDLERGGGGDDDAPAKPKRRAPRRQRTDSRTRHDKPSLERRLQESIESVGGWISERGDDELGEILERDAQKMAGVLGKVAKTNPVARQAVGVLADLLEPVRAFGPTLRVLYSRLVFRREQARAEAALEAELGGEEVTPVVAVPAPGGGDEPEAEIAEPWRLPG